MPEEEQKRTEILQEADPATLGQLNPGYTPHQPVPQSWEKTQGRGGFSGRARMERPESQPEFTALESQDLSASAREIAGNLGQIELSSFGDRAVLSEQSQVAGQQLGNSIDRHQQQKEQESARGVEQEQRKEQGYER